MALAAAQLISIAGSTPAYNTPLASENISPAANLFLHVKNANAANCVVTIDDSGVTPGGSAATDPVVTVPLTTGDKMIPLPTSFTNTATGFINVTFSVQTSVSVALLRLP